MRIKRVVAMLSVCIVLCFLAAAQQSGGPPPLPRARIPASPDDSDARDRVARDMAKKANQERAAALKADTDKLLKLATELKASVDKSDENVLSVDVIRKAEAIEKLARSVKDKMKGPN